MKKYDVYGIGNALVDYLLFVEESFLIKYNIKKGIMTLADKPADQELTEKSKSSAKICGGGSAANTIVTIAALGGKSCYSSKVSDDPNGRFYIDDLNKAGVDFFGKPAQTPTGSCVSYITGDAERSMVTYLGAATELSIEDIDEKAIRESDYIYIEGYLWDSDSAREAALHAIKLAYEAETKVALSCSDPFVVDRYHDSLMEICQKYVDLLLCNEQEAEMMTSRKDSETATAELGKMIEHVCVTLGADGAIVSDDTRITKTPALNVDTVLDTTGAGDIYAAGVLHGLTRGYDLVCSSMIGSRYAASIVTKVGARL